MTDPAQPSAWGTEVPTWEPEVPPRAPDTPAAPGAARPPGRPQGSLSSLQEHHEGWTLGQPLPAEPALMAAGEPPGGSPATGAAADGTAAGPAVAPGERTAAPAHDDRWAMACYLGAIFFWLLAPLFIYLAKRNRSIFIRSHAVQAFNLTLTATLFAVSGAIISGLLALDSPKAALFIVGPVLLAFWIVVLTYLIRAASSASRGDFYELPGWICVPMLR